MANSKTTALVVRCCSNCSNWPYLRCCDQLVINAITNSNARDVSITHARGSISKEEARDSANTGVNGG
jgi:hypothetical protein